MFEFISSPTLSLIPLAAGVFLASLCIRASKAKTGSTLRNCLRCTPTFLLLAVLAGMNFSHLVSASPLALIFVTLAALISGVCALYTKQIRAVLFNEVSTAAEDVAPEETDYQASISNEYLKKHAVSILAILVSTVFMLLSVELPYQNPGLQLMIEFAIPDYGLTLLVVLVIYFLSGRRAIGIRIPAVIFAIIGLANFFVWQFKNAAILPSDLFALGTAAAVAGGYSYTLRDPALFGLGFAFLANALACIAEAPGPSTKAIRPMVEYLKNVGIALGFVAILAFSVIVPDYRYLGAGVNYFWPLYTYRIHGTLLSFVAGCQDLIIRTPEGYTVEAAQALEDSYVDTFESTLASTSKRKVAVVQAESVKPNIVVIMDETFSDLSIYDELHAGYTGPEFFKTGLRDALESGKLAVSVYGGGTCNTEFEFLTGNSFGYLGQGKYPYSMYDLGEVPSLTQQLKSLGYYTTAMHPNYPSNWNRDTVYEDFGFDQFLSIDDFRGDPYLHNGITDEATFDRALKILQTSDTPQFVFDVTMQNHSEYTRNNIPDDLRVDYQPDYGDSELTSKLNEYLSCIKASDLALEKFVGQLRNLDEPTLVVFFGDHQPNFSADYNDAWFSDKDELIHTQREYETVYTIWANYDVAGADQSGTQQESSPAYLAAQLLYQAGLPLTDYQKAQLVARQTIPAINAFGTLGTDGKWYELSDDKSPGAQTVQDMSLITYLNFATKIS